MRRGADLSQEEVKELTDQFYVTLRAYVARLDKEDENRAPRAFKQVEDLLLKEARASWSDAYQIEQLLVDLFDDSSLEVELQSRLLDYVSEPLVQKEAGLWLRERYAQDERLMIVSPSIAFYFYDARHQGNAVDLPWTEYPALVDFARRQEVGLLAASEWQLEAARFPTAGQLVPEGRHPGLTWVATLGREPRRVHVFRVDR